MKFLQYVLIGAMGFCAQIIFTGAIQEKPLRETGCDSYIEIHGSSNVNQFQLINHSPKVVNLSQGNKVMGGYQRVEIDVNQFKADNTQMREDFLEMVNAKEYPVILMDIEPRSLAECKEKTGLPNFRTIINIAGVSRSYIVPCKIDSCQSSGYQLKGKLNFKLTDFEINPPQRIFGLVKVNDEVFIDYAFRFLAEDDIFK